MDAVEDEIAAAQVADRAIRGGGSRDEDFGMGPAAAVRIASQNAAFSACISGRLYIGRLACGIRPERVP
ncbi:MAG TPA: hypothetical protein VHX39_02740 [Acetobacteraceae bacterium]|nr:hypothetical protein [Acetobacteraceae bacterium]